MSRVRYIARYNHIDFYVFNPTVFSLYWKSYTKKDEPDYWKSRSHLFRMVKLFFFNRYKVLYAVKDGVTIGHMVVSYILNEISNATKRDIIIGPKWIASSCREMGYGTDMLRFALSNDLFDFNCAYEMISSVNYASIRVVEKCVYIKATNDRRGKFGKIIADNNGSWCLYRYSKNNKVVE